MVILSKTFSPQHYFVRYSVNPQHDGLRLDRFLQFYLKTFSRESIKKKIMQGDVVIENRKGIRRSSSKLRSNDIVSLSIYKNDQEDEYWRKEKILLEKIHEIIFEDQHLIAISKPAYMSTHPTGRHLFNCVTVYLEEIYKRTIHSIHRLDRETSGILLLGKDIPTASALGNLFENNLVQKCYLFISKTKTPYGGPSIFTENSSLFSPKKGKVRILVRSAHKASENKKKASTSFKILLKRDHYILGLAFPKTGRQHQIRIHSSHNAFPILGDKLYLGGYTLFQRFKDRTASEEDHSLLEVPRQALHALFLKIQHRDKKHIFCAPLPGDITEWISFYFNKSSDQIKSMIAEEFALFKREDL